MRDLPLAANHAALGASFETVCNWRVPSRYGDPLDEHRAARTAAGLSDVSHQGRIAVHGPDRRAVLERLLSNDILHLSCGEGVAACLLTAAGTIVTDVTVYDRGEHLLCVLRPEGTAPFVEGIQAHVAASRSSLEDVAGQGALFYLAGPAHGAVLDRVFGAGGAPARGCRRVEWEGHAIWLMGYPASRPVDRLVEVPISAAQALFERLLQAGAGLGLRLVGRQAQEILRIEAGRPLLGVDIDRSHDPGEVNLEDAVSLRKTRYRGWEHVAARRLRGGPVRRLVGVKASRMVQPGAVVVGDGRLLGRVTSAAWSPCLQASLGLAVVPAMARPDQVRVCSGGEDHDASLVDVPVAA